MPEFSNELIQILLVRRALGKALSAEEIDTLTQWAGDSAYRNTIVEQAGDPKVVGGALEIFDSVDEERLWANTKLFVPVKIVHRVHFLRKQWLPYAAAILLIICACVYFWMPPKIEKTTSAVAVAPVIKPGGNHATLTLSDGRVVLLDSASSGAIAQEGLTSVVKRSDGAVVYDAAQGGGADQALIYNTMSTPRGGQYQLTLPDGTQVWLNAASSITFPVLFNTETRDVKITGEVYFEVAADAKRPFAVSTPHASIHVLGTSFNVNAYAEEIDERTTLINGKVKVSSGNTQLLLSPGQQAVQLNNQISLEKNVDIEQVTAWKNGGFNFEGQNVQQVMRQLSRWYDIDVRYEGKIPDIEFGGTMGRNLDLSQVLKALNYAGLQYKIENKTLTVFSK